MHLPDITNFIQQLELKTKKMLSGPLLSEWKSKRKGAGLEFYQVRDYQQGDDIRFIDWKSSAKTQKLLVKEYLEDRNRTVVLAVDVSASTVYGSRAVLKAERIQELAAILALLALHTKDAVGLMLFTKEVEVFIPPRTGRSHVMSLIKTLLTYTPRYQTTDLVAALTSMRRFKQKNVFLCLISDFTAPSDSSLLRVLARRYEMKAFRCLDQNEISFPDVGILTLEDSETNEHMSIDTAHQIQKELQLWRKEWDEHFKNAGVACFDTLVGSPFITELARFLRYM
jgi:uncharacterized protein (DUF58 family)